MRKVVVETGCGEETRFCVEQDVSSITVDGEEWVKKTDENKDKPWRKTELLRLNGEGWAISTLMDVDGVYLEEAKNNINYIDIKNSDGETLAKINRGCLKNVKF